MDKNLQTKSPPATHKTPLPAPKYGGVFAPSDQQKKRDRKKAVIIVSAIGIAIIAWFIGAHFFGPKSQYGIENNLKILRTDSVALQDKHLPNPSWDWASFKGHYKDLTALGNPYKQLDSLETIYDSRLERLASYNKERLDTILNETIDVWRRTAMLIMERELREKNEYTKIIPNRDYPDDTGIIVYSLRYADPKEVKKDASRYNYFLEVIGFKSVTYAMSSVNESKEYTF